MLNLIIKEKILTITRKSLTTKEENLFLSIISLKSIGVYSSNYYLTNLNEKFLNLINLKKIIDFKSNVDFWCNMYLYKFSSSKI